LLANTSSAADLPQSPRELKRIFRRSQVFVHREKVDTFRKSRFTQVQESPISAPETPAVETKEGHEKITETVIVKEIKPEERKDTTNEGTHVDERSSGEESFIIKEGYSSNERDTYYDSDDTFVINKNYGSEDYTSAYSESEFSSSYDSRSDSDDRTGSDFTDDETVKKKNDFWTHNHELLEGLEDLIPVDRDSQSGRSFSSSSQQDNLRKILEEPKPRKYFERYLENNPKDENNWFALNEVAFYVAVMEYTKQSSEAMNARTILEKFIYNTIAEHPINIKEVTRYNIIKNFGTADQDPKTIFQEAQEEVLEIMNRMYLPGFLTSDEFLFMKASDISTLQLPFVSY